MLPTRLILAVLLSIASAAAQSAGPSVTVTVSKQINLPVEQVNFDIVVTSGLDATIDQVLTVVQNLRLTVKDLVGLGSFAPNFDRSGIPATQFLWQFRLVRPFAQLQPTLAELQSWSNNADKKFTGTYSLATLTTTEATARRLADDALPDLIADARVKAQHLADAAGLTVGSILSLTNASILDPVKFAVAPRAAAILSSGTGIVPVLTFLTNPFFAPTSTASVTIRFSLLRYSNPY
jgi:hypothetical protein